LSVHVSQILGEWLRPIRKFDEIISKAAVTPLMSGVVKDHRITIPITAYNVFVSILYISFPLWFSKLFYLFRLFSVLKKTLCLLKVTIFSFSNTTSTSSILKNFLLLIPSSRCKFKVCTENEIRMYICARVSEHLHWYIVLYGIEDNIYNNNKYCPL
jgi:hypothetical protein